MIGASTSKALDLTLLNKGDMVYGTSTIKVEIGLKIGSKIEYIPMGIYNIDDIEKTDYTVKITAFDNMIKFEKNFTTNLGDTLTLQQVVNELARITGVQFTGSVPAYTVKKLEGFSCREVLGYVASICGGNAVITRDGKFTIATPKDINYSIGTSNYFDYKREETKYKIGKISCQVGEKVLSKGALGANSMELEFENPWVTDSILQDIYNKLNGFEYLGYFMKWQGDLSLDVGDIVTITDKKGVARKHPILSQKFTYTGGLTSEIEAKGENKNKNSFDSSGSMKKKVDRVVTELAIVNEALVDVAYIGDLTAGNIKFDTATGNVMDLQTLLAKHISGENGQFLNITTANTTIGDAVIKDAMIDTVSASKLNAGTVNTNKVNIQSENGGIVIADNTQQFKDKNGKVRIQMGQDKNGKFNFAVFDETGVGILIDATGVKEKALADGIIKDRMINEGEIGGEKINISSLITEINKDKNTETIKSTKVQLDTENQTLDIAFKTLKTNVDNMEIGGRNYIKDYKFKKEDIWKKSRKEAQIDTTQGCGYLSGTTENPFLYQDLEIGLIKKGDTLTLQYEVKFDGVSRNTGTKSFLIRTHLTGYSGNNSMIQDIGIFGKHESDGLYLNQGWQKVVKTITITSNAVFDYARFRLYARNFNGTIYFRNVKLEKGSKATDLSPALEDIDSKIEANTTAISAVQGKIGTLIKDTTIEKDGKEIKLKDAYSTLIQDVSSITTTVSSTETKINNLQIGGRNLFLNSSFKDGTKYWYTHQASIFEVVKSSDSLSGYCVKFNSTANGNGGIFQKRSGTSTTPYPKGTKLVVSGYFKCNLIRYLKIALEGTKEYIYTPKHAGVWAYFECPFEANGTSNTIIFYGEAGCVYHLKDVKLEYGTKATTYTPAPEDIDSNISDLSSRVKSAEQKLEPDKIVATVKDHQTNGVNTFATSSDVKQTTDAWVAKFSSRGGYNLIRNGNVTRHRLNFWWLENGANIWHEGDSWIGIYKHSDTEGFLVSETIKVEPGKTYSFSCQVSAEGNTLGADVYFIGSSSNDRAYGWTPQLGSVANGESKTIEYTFTVPHHINYGYIRLDANGSTNYSGGFVCWFKNMVLIEGSVPAKTFIPNKSEIYEGSTMIDASGVTINNGALTVKNKAGATVLSGDSNGNLKLSGNISSGATISGGVLKASNDDLYFDLNKGYMVLHNNGSRIGQTQKNKIENSSIYGITNGAEYGCYSTLAAKLNPSTSLYSMMLTVSGADLGYGIKSGVNLGSRFHTNNWHLKMGSSSELQWRQNGSEYDSFITEGSEGMLRLYGDNGMYLGYRAGSTNTYIIAIREFGSHELPRSLSMFNSDNDSISDGEYSVEITAPLKMRGQSINECSNIKTLGLEIVEPTAFYSRDSEEETRTYTVTKNSQNIIEFIGSTEIINGESIVTLPENIVFKHYVVMLSPIGLNKSASLVEKSDNSFKIMGDDGIVDYVIKFESVNYAKYMAKSISIDNVDTIKRSEDDLPKIIDLN